MSEIPFRSLATAPTSLRLSENFDIRSIEQVLGGSDVVQALHRHDHYFLLVLTTGEGVHECDFRPHALAPHTIYAMRPGQVHRLVLKAGSTGYILQFKADFLATSCLERARRTAGAAPRRPPGGLPHRCRALR